MRIFTILLLFGLSTPVWSQLVLTITDARKSSPVAPYAYYFEDLTHKLTYEQVSHFPLDSFQPINRQGAIQLGIRLGTVWLRFHVNNQTDRELVLLSTQWKFAHLNVYVRDENGQLTVQHLPSSIPFSRRIAPIAQALSSLGKYPRTVHIAVRLDIGDFYNDYLQLTDIGNAMRYQKQTSFWQGGLAGIYLLTILFALVFFFRLRDPLLGWYALFIWVSTHWFLDRSAYLLEFFGQDSWYAHFRPYYPIHLAFMAVWVVFLIKLINLQAYSRFLYYLLIFWIVLDSACYLYLIGSVLLGKPYPIMRVVTHWLGIEYVGYWAIGLLLLLISVIYVSIRNFRIVRWYALAFSIGLISMIIAILALFDITWLPHYPYNNFYFIGSFLEIIILGFVLAERANRHRNEQNQTQRQLIDQLQENLNQKNKLLQIRDEIARDLHDEVGATLTSIAISTKLIQKKVNGQQPDLTPILQQIQTDSQDTIHSLRDTVWALNPDNDAPEKLLERMRAVGLQLLTTQDITLNFTCEVNVQELPALSMEQRRHVYFVFKEAIHNIVKHAQATYVYVHIAQQGNELYIRISDNGRGFDVRQVREGNGLTNFQKRATEGSLRVVIRSEAGKGSTVEIRIPV